MEGSSGDKAAALIDAERRLDGVAVSRASIRNGAFAPGNVEGEEAAVVVNTQLSSWLQLSVKGARIAPIYIDRKIANSL